MRRFTSFLRTLVLLGFFFNAAPFSAMAAGTDPAILAAVDAAIAAVNSGSITAAKDAFTDAPVAIVDDFPPYLWSGKNAFEDYSRDLKTILAQLKIENWRFQRHQPRYVSASEDRASVVVPASFPFTMNGKPGSVSGDYVFVLKKVSGKWRVDLATYGATHHTLLP